VQVIFPTADHAMYHCLEKLFAQHLRLREDVRKCIDQLFVKGERFYEGYCNDPRNTDNTWLEAVACNYRDYNYALSDAIEQVLLHCIFIFLFCDF